MAKRFLLVACVSILLIGSAGASGYFYFQWKKAITVPDTQEELSDVLSVVSQYMELPQGEDPTLATVIDKEKLKDQAFFVNAENGDKVLIYTTAKKAMLYRPSTKKVIEVAPIYFNKEQLDQAQDPSTAAPEEVRTVRIAYYNGTTITGHASATEARIKQNFTNTETIVVGNAKSKYTGTIVVDLTGAMNVEVDGIAQLLNGQVQELPAGEDRPAADILIIVGQ